jgi:hypothetical protein
LGSRLTLTWETCSICRRRSPTIFCRRAGVWVCAWCISVIECEPRSRPISRRSVRSLAPDEDLIESIASRRRVKS